MHAGEMGPDEALGILRDLGTGGGTGAEAARAEIALVLGEMNDPDCDGLLLQLLNDSSPVVVRASLEGAARTGRRLFLPLIVPHLGDERLMLFAQRALLAYGDRVLGTLRDYMDDSGEPEGVRRAVPGCLAAIGTQGAAEMLLLLLRDHQKTWGDAVVEALSEVQDRGDGLVFDEALVVAAVRREIESDQLADERWIWRIAELMALIYPPEDIRRAYAGLISSERTLQSNALELLDNLLRPEHKQRLLPRLESWISEDG
jgi:HEAT repeat protein